MKEEAQKLQRPFSEEMEEILGITFPVLDDGFVRVVDYMGTDESIVQAARVSYGKGTTKVSQDEGLIRYLLRHKHTTPFEMCELKLHVRVPMDCWRQWIRHRTANVNEYSTRYSEAIDSKKKTKPDEWRVQSTTNKQGSEEGQIKAPEQTKWHSGPDPQKCPGEYLTFEEAEFHNIANELYKKRLEFGVAREQARKDLPLSTYTEAYWKVDLHNLLHFLGLRMDKHAQYEIRQYANTIGNEIVSKWAPLTWKAFKEYKLNSLTFSEREIAIMNLMLKGTKTAVYAVAKEYGWFVIASDGKLKRNRERAEFEEKMKIIGMEVPWDTPNS